MRKGFVGRLTLILAIAALSIQGVFAQGRTAADLETITKRTAIEAELQSIAVVDRKVMVPMRDGKRMAADIYRPKDNS